MVEIQSYEQTSNVVKLVQQYCGASKIIWSTAILLIAENHVFLQYLSSNYDRLR